MHPRAVLAGERDRRLERVERAGVHLARLKTHDRRPVDLVEGERQRVGGDAALVVGVDLDDGVLADPEVAHGPVDGVVP